MKRFHLRKKITYLLWILVHQKELAEAVNGSEDPLELDRTVCGVE